MKSAHSAIGEFLRGLDVNDRARLKALGMVVYDNNCNSFPGPDAFVKKFARSHVEAFVESLINDLLQWDTK